MNHEISNRHFVLAGILVLAAFSRLIPHPPNFTALGAMALFGGAYIHNRILAVLFPLSALWISDIILNNLVYSEFYKGFVLFSNTHIWIYISFVIIAILGQLIIKKVNIKTMGLSAISASILFFILSNFGVWAQGLMYPLSFSGLIACYIAALPFFGWTLIGNFFFCAILFGSFELAANKIISLQTVVSNK